MARVHHKESLSPSPSPQPGKWVKGKVIGRGSHGTVHLAMNKANGSFFVVKSASTEIAVQCLKNEADMLESFYSPYIVQCLGRNMPKGSKQYDVFVEYMAGGSLLDVVEAFGGALEEELIRLYAKGILCGLKYLHDKGIVHCDIKCKNLLLDPSGNIKLADFGCAKRIGIEDFDKGRNLSYSWQSVGGTPLWMAPEVLRTEGLCSASDIWSLGCTVIEMATGRPPWSDEVSSPIAGVMKIACSDKSPRFPINFSAEGMDFLAKCLERKPEKRWTAEELLNHPFISGDSPQTGACSPSSVLDIYEAFDSDELENPDEDLYQSRNPFRIRHCDDKVRMARRMEAKSDFGSSEEGWITVR